MVREWQAKSSFERKLYVLCIPSFVFVLLTAISLLFGFNLGPAFLPAMVWSQSIWSVGVTLHSAWQDVKGRTPPNEA